MVTIDDYFEILGDDLYRACKTYRLYNLLVNAVASGNVMADTDIASKDRANLSRYVVRVCMLYISIEMLLRGDY